MRFFSSGTRYTLAFLLVFQIGSAFAGISCPNSVSGSHCDVISFSVGVDSAIDISGLTFSATTDGSGPVAVDSFGRVSYVPFPFVADEPVMVFVSAVSGAGVNYSCTTSVVVTNVATKIICPENASVVRGRANTVEGIRGIDPDACDALTYSLVSVFPEPQGVVTVNSNTGAVTFAAEESDAPGHDVDYQIVAAVTDGHASDTCSFTFTALHEEAFSFRIDREKYGIIGFPTKLHVILDGGTENLDGFNLLLTYDAFALTLREIHGGNMFGSNNRGSLSHRVKIIDGCSGSCPSGLVHLSGKVNSSSTEPGLLQIGDTIATLDFVVTPDRNIGCQFLPVRWIWQNCDDNLVFSRDDDATYISRRVFDYIGTNPSNTEHGGRAEITGSSDTFPTFRGALASCESNMRSDYDNITRFVDFKNGGVKVPCPCPIDDRGDLNLNGISYEEADLELFIQYFLFGLDVFAEFPLKELAIASSNVNGDSLALTVADLVYFIRTFLAEAVPRYELTHDRDTVTFKHKHGRVISDLMLGAAFFEFEGNPHVQLLDSTMEMRTGLLGGRKRVLVFKIGSAELAPERILLTEGKILSAEASDFNGSRVVVEFDIATDVTADENTLLPDEFQLHQNYPNPFNPATTIEFALPERGAVELIIYNTLGRKVRTLASGMYSAGRYSVSWDGTDEDGRQVTSGVYYYRLKAGDVVQSRKMVLLK